MNHKEMTQHIRNRIKAAGIKARCKMQDGCSGNRVIYVFAPAYGVEFSEADQRTVRLIAKTNRLTWVQGMEINLEQMTNPNEFHFYMPEA